jgi:hypothetical protein
MPADSFIIDTVNRAVTTRLQAIIADYDQRFTALETRNEAANPAQQTIQEQSLHL